MGNLKKISIWNTLSNFINKVKNPDPNTLYFVKADAVVESYNNGYSWYRLYSDGWCEQGGRTLFNVPNNTEVIFHKPFINTYYSFFVTGERDTRVTGAAFPDDLSFTTNGKSTDRVVVYGYDSGGSRYTCYGCWEAKGYVRM